MSRQSTIITSYNFIHAENIGFQNRWPGFNIASVEIRIFTADQ
jgi:hypothetical protein